jgi:NADH:ubiquinone oxidoreductase subunit E
VEKIKVSICTGTACYVMGASEFLVLEDSLPEHLKGKVEITGLTCLDKCKNSKCGKSPFVLVNDEIIADATLSKILDKIMELAEE